jgi:hypothetical protein
MLLLAGIAGILLLLLLLIQYLWAERQQQHNHWMSLQTHGGLWNRTTESSFLHSEVCESCDKMLLTDDHCGTALASLIDHEAAVIGAVAALADLPDMQLVRLTITKSHASDVMNAEADLLTLCSALCFWMYQVARNASTPKYSVLSTSTPTVA